VRGALTLCFVLFAAGATPTTSSLDVVVPDRENRQFLLFWVAYGAGLFREQGVDVRITSAPAPKDTPDLLLQSDAACAVLPSPMYFGLIERKAPVVLVANLLARESANLIIRTELANRFSDKRKATLAERMSLFRGKKIGVAAGPRPRLTALLDAAGLGPDDVRIEILHGDKQNEALATGKVDAIYAHTPYFERAIVSGEGALWVNTSAGEVARLDHLLVHALVCKQAAVATRADAIEKVVRALDESRKLTDKDLQRATRALAAGLGQPSSPELSTLVAVYRMALPADVRPRVADMVAGLSLFPQGQGPMQRDTASLSRFIAADLSAPMMVVVPNQRSPWWLLCLAVGGMLLFIVFATWLGFVLARRGRSL
jgi:ABC-type nitrate/sulfonate/bicarbonate transport system substrate-binding protein